MTTTKWIGFGHTNFLIDASCSPAAPVNTSEAFSPDCEHSPVPSLVRILRKRRENEESKEDRGGEEDGEVAHTREEKGTQARMATFDSRGEIAKNSS